ncbi:MAG: alpha/beta fold hydrolase [Vicinamibacterales bacterium]
MSFTTGAPPAPMSLHHVRLSNGLTLHFAAQGPKTGPAVVLLHGFTDSWFSFSRVLPLLPADLRVIAPDMRGHGDSERPPLGYHLADLADDVLRLMDALQIPKAVLIGHSMGSFVARKVYELAPDRVSRLVLTGAGPAMQTPGMPDFIAAVEGLSEPVDEMFVREFQMSTIAAPVPEPFMNAVIANSRRMPARIWKAVARGLMEGQIVLSSPDVRTLVVGGRQDAIFSATEQMALARQFPRGELHLVDGVGHTLHWEQPETFVSALIRFGV